MTSPKDRVTSLIAKAVDPVVPEEEARSLALIAVRLIDQYKMLAPLPPPEPTQPQPKWEPAEDFFERLRRAAREAQRARQAQPTSASQHWTHRLPMELTIMQDKTCSVCGQVCPGGSQVWAIRMERVIAMGQFPEMKPVVCHIECRGELPDSDRPKVCSLCHRTIDHANVFYNMADNRTFHTWCAQVAGFT